MLVLERDLGRPNENRAAKFSDLNMLVNPGGRERSEEEYAALFSRAGLRTSARLRAQPDSASSKRVASSGERAACPREAAPPPRPTRARVPSSLQLSCAASVASISVEHRVHRGLGRRARLPAGGGARRRIERVAQRRLVELDRPCRSQPRPPRRAAPASAADGGSPASTRSRTARPTTLCALR